MTMLRRRWTLVGGLTVLFALALGGPALALDDTKPTPTCAGVDFTDPAGDAAIDPVGIGLGAIPAPDNMDITGGFFKYDADASGTASLTANIEVANLTKDVPAGATGSRWYFFWTSGSQVYFVTAGVDATGAETYTYGHQAQILQTDGTTTGKLFPGEKGILQIKVPQGATGAGDGKKLLSPYASSRAEFNLVAVAYIPTADDAPDSQAGKAYTVAQCGGTATASSALPITLLTSSAKASKAKKGKSLSFKLTSTDQVTDIKGTLKKGKTSYGSGKLAILAGNGTLKVKLKKALKKGTYKLNLTGTTSDGPGKATFSVKVR
jgi:methionine-rich copper-binding protein CopC